MKLWNLSEFPALEEPVVLSYSKSETHTRAPMRPAQKQPRLKVALSVATLAVSFSIGLLQANSTKVTLPLSAVAVAQSISEEQPPLEEFFGTRFTDRWTEKLEHELLMSLEKRRVEGSSRSLVEQTIDTVFSNQHEDLSEQRNRMSREHIATLVRARKLVR